MNNTINSAFSFFRKQIKSLRFMGLFLAFLMVGCGEENSSATGQLHIERAAVYESQGQYKAAFIEYRNAIKKSKGEEAAVVAYARMMNELSQYKGAQGLLENHEGSKGQEYYLELVEALIGLRKFQSAQAILDNDVDLNTREVKLYRAETLVGNGSLQEALDIYEQLLAEKSTDGEALLGKASILLRRESLDEARELLSSIEESDSAYIQSQTLFSGLLISSEKLEEAETLLTKLLSLLPNSDMMKPEKAVVLERLSYVLTRLGRSNEAYIYTKLLSEAFPGVNEMNEKYARAVEVFKSGDLAESKVLLMELVSEFPGNVRANQLLGIVSYLQGDHEQAVDYFSGSVDPEVANPMATQFYVASSLKMNEPKKVLELLDDTVEQTSSAETLALYGLAAMSDGQYAKGENAVMKAIALAPNNYKFHLLHATLHREKPTPDLVKEYAALKKAHESASTELQVLKDLLGYYLRTNDRESGESFVQSQLESHGQHYSSQLIAGYFYATYKKAEKAATHFELAAKLESDGILHRDALFGLGRVQVVSGKYTDAAHTFKSMVDKFPQDKLGYQGVFSVEAFDSDDKAFELLERLAEKNNSKEAYKVAAQAALVKQDTPLANRFVSKAKVLGEDEELRNLTYSIALVEARLAVGRKDYEAARELIAPVLVAKPDNASVLSFLVNLEIGVGNLQEAQKVLDQIKHISADAPFVNVLSGDMAMANNEFGQAKTFYNSAWDQTKNEIVANKLFRILGRLNEQDAQSAFLVQWLETLPNSVNATLFSAMDNQSKGKLLEAKSGYERVLSALPDNITVLNNLGWLYFEEGNKKALDLLSRAAELAPGNPAVLDSYGWVLAKFGQPDKGLPYLEKANQLAPEMEEISKHLADVKAML